MHQNYMQKKYIISIAPKDDWIKFTKNFNRLLLLHRTDGQHVLKGCRVSLLKTSMSLSHGHRHLRMQPCILSDGKAVESIHGSEEFSQDSWRGVVAELWTEATAPV